MPPPTPDFKFSANGGAVQVVGGTYLPRAADEALYQACKSGEFASVLACRQIGKSSLMIATANKLTEEGIKTAVVDLNKIGGTTVKEDDLWYFNFVDTLAEALHFNQIKPDFDVESWWVARRQLSLVRRLGQFLGEVVLAEIDSPIVIFVDEIDATLPLDFTDDFFAAIRSIYNDRAGNKIYGRLTFVLLGMAAPDELIKDSSRTPFNIGKRIELLDFSKTECLPLQEALKAAYPNRGEAYFGQVFGWTNGHPFLTQKLAHDVLRTADEDTPDLVDSLVRKQFLQPGIRREPSLSNIQNRIKDDPYANEILRTYQSILENETPIYDDQDSPAISRLKLYGMVKTEREEQTNQDRLIIRSKLYATLFDVRWAKEVSQSIAGFGLPDNYHIVSQIGRGGFATVWLAQMSSISGEAKAEPRNVAVKMLTLHNKANPEQTKLLRRFNREVRAAQKLEHPNIIRILDSGERDTGPKNERTLYITMDFIAGGTVRQKLNSDQSLSRAEAIEIICQVGDALAYAHGRGIIHRDVNPNNILLETRGAQSRAILADFGLVKILEDDHHSHTNSEKPNGAGFVGTYRYMAPEQWLKETTTAKTDIYALALTAFEMLAGQYPFPSNSPFDIKDHHLNTPMPRLSQVNPPLGTYFDEVLIKGAAKKPDDRYENVVAFIEALREANALAEREEQLRHQDRISRQVDLARDWLQTDPEEALRLIAPVLRDHPEHIEALRLKGKIHLERKQYQDALDAFKGAFNEAGTPASEAGLDYLKALGFVADVAWLEGDFNQAVIHYQTIHQILAGHPSPNVAINGIWEEARRRLIEHHHHLGERAYMNGRPLDVEMAIDTLETAINILHSLKAESETAELEQMRRSLQIKKYSDAVKAQKQAIKTAAPADGQYLLRNEEQYLEPYIELDRAYQELIALEPENKQWVGEQQKHLMEQATIRVGLGTRAESKLEPDYDAAIRHYRCILDLEESGRYPDLGQALRLNLPQKINRLQRLGDHEGKYQAIKKLIEAQEFNKALELLHAHFSESNYDYRDVAKFLWGAIYARNTNGKLPPEWTGHSGFEMLSRRLIPQERERLQILSNQLVLWSSEKFLPTLHDKDTLLKDFSSQVEGSQRLIEQAVELGQADEPEVSHCRDELQKLGQQINQLQNNYLNLNRLETAHTVEGWLEKIRDLEALLDSDEPRKDLPVYFNRNDQELQLIEKDEMHQTLQTLAMAEAEIAQGLEAIKSRMGKEVIPILIGDIGQRDEALAALRRDLAQVQEAKDSLQLDHDTAQEQAAQSEENLGTVQQALEQSQKENSAKERVIKRNSRPLFIILGGLLLIGVWIAFTPTPPAQSSFLIIIIGLIFIIWIVELIGRYYTK